jgi:hypothetical protein
MIGSYTERFTVPVGQAECLEGQGEVADERMPTEHSVVERRYVAWCEVLSKPQEAHWVTVTASSTAVSARNSATRSRRRVVLQLAAGAPAHTEVARADGCGVFASGQSGAVVIDGALQDEPDPVGAVARAGSGHFPRRVPRCEAPYRVRRPAGTRTACAASVLRSRLEHSPPTWPSASSTAGEPHGPDACEMDPCRRAWKTFERRAVDRITGRLGLFPAACPRPYARPVSASSLPGVSAITRGRPWTSRR